MHERPPHPPRRRWLVSALLVVALLVVGQGVHLPGSHHEGMQPEGVETSAEMPHGHGAAAAIADCSDSVCSLCVTPVAGVAAALPRAAIDQRSAGVQLVLAAPPEQPYRPPIDPA